MTFAFALAATGLLGRGTGLFDTFDLNYSAGFAATFRCLSATFHFNPATFGRTRATL